ncbi:lytic transglycosylase domain-containing protein [Saccharibacillus sp. CPCC 101409]|uniref:lytic transglycosylase domain-containing protein n=1 Tax=Saccharibacillus sp. CPCC 101409 TaxID=3058041 RepID=UPI002673A694|nr:lytic transglycosylase domain-containing protein [Saccharibacillus sp. CPCC 101409]MDO3409186.1 lytic transglycosylase domain-containing protein [Saccharibacillus sp. CPCC 101409]
MIIDPRTAKQLIEFQWIDSMNLDKSSLNSMSQGKIDSSVFATLLQQKMQESGTSSISAEELLKTLDAISLPADQAASLKKGAMSLDGGSSLDSSPAKIEMPSVSEPKVQAGTPNSNAAQYADIVAAASAKYGIPQSLINGIIDAESSFNPNARSGAGAKGLMQLMDGTAAGLGVTNSFDPEQNINGGSSYIASQLMRYGGSQRLALAAYNAGPGTLQRLGIKTEADLDAKFSQLPRETQNYIGRVETAQAKYV